MPSITLAVFVGFLTIGLPLPVLPRHLHYTLGLSPVIVGSTSRIVSLAPTNHGYGIAAMRSQASAGRCDGGTGCYPGFSNGGNPAASVNRR
jgi:hypothetical protein